MKYRITMRFEKTGELKVQYFKELSDLLLMEGILDDCIDNGADIGYVSHEWFYERAYETKANGREVGYYFEWTEIPD